MDSLAGITAPLCTSCAAAKSVLLQAMRSPLVWDDVVSVYASNHLYRRTIRGFVSGIAYFGPSLPQVTGSPLHVTWNFTAKCSLECLHCYSDNKKKKPREELTEKETMSLVDNLARSGVAILTLSGGEPMQRKDIFRVAKRATEKGIYVRVETSGQMLNKKTATSLSTSGVKSVIVPIDGGYPRTHDIFRQKPGCFMKASLGLSESKDVGFDELGVEMSLTGKSWMEVAMVYDHAKAMGANSFCVSSLLPIGKGKDLRMPVTTPQRIEVMRFLLSKLPAGIEGKGPLPFTRWMPYYGRFVSDAGTVLPDPVSYFALKSLGKDQRFNISALRTAKVFTQLFSTSRLGITDCAISNDGFLLPAAPLGSKMVDLTETDLASAWRKDSLFNHVRDRIRLKGKCHSCVKRQACGGSRLQAFASGYDWLEADPSCPY